MSTNRQEYRAYPTRTIDTTLLNALLDKATDKYKAAHVDFLAGGEGGFLSGVTVSATSPASKSIEIAALEGMDTNGEHLRKATTTTLDCTSDKDGTNLFPGGVVAADTWISVFCRFAWTESDLNTVGGVDYYGLRTEGVAFWVVKGTASAKPANPGSGSIKVCDIYLDEGVASIAADKIYYTQPLYQDGLTPIHSGFAKKSGAQFTGDIYRSLSGVKRPYTYRNGGTFAWPVASLPLNVPSDANAWPIWGYYANSGYVYIAHTIYHGLGNVQLSEFRAQPCLTENNQAGGYSFIETLLGGNIPGVGGGLATGNVVSLQAYPYNGTVTVVVFGTAQWVNWFRYANGVARNWRWAAFV